MGKNTVLNDSRVTQKIKKSWSLVLVGSRGEVFSISRFKELFAGICILLVAAVCLAVLFFSLYRIEAETNNELLASLDTKSEQMTELVKKNEQLMTSLAAKSAQPETAKPAKVSSKKTPSQPKPPKIDKPFAEPEKPKTQKEPESVVKADADVTPDVEVGVDNFKFSRAASGDSVKIQFIIRNVSTGRKTASGFIFAVLKRTPHDGEPVFVSLPLSQLKNAVPADYKNGQEFSISRYKTVRFSSAVSKTNGTYTNATIIVFDNNGKKIFSKPFTVTDTYKPPAPLAGETAPAQTY